MSFFVFNIPLHSTALPLTLKSGEVPIKNRHKSEIEEERHVLRTCRRVEKFVKAKGRKAFATTPTRSGWEMEGLRIKASFTSHTGKEDRLDRVHVVSNGRCVLRAFVDRKGSKSEAFAFEFRLGLWQRKIVLRTRKKKSRA